MGIGMLIGNGLSVLASSSEEVWFTSRSRDKDSIVSLVMHLTNEVKDNDGNEVVVTHYVEPKQYHTLIPGTSEEDFFRYWPEGKVLYGWKSDPNSSTAELTSYRGFQAPDTAGKYDYYADWRDGWKLSFYSYSKDNASNPDGYYSSPEFLVSNLYVLKGESFREQLFTPTCSDSSRSFDHWEDQNGKTYQSSDIAGQQFTEDMKFWPVWSSDNSSGSTVDLSGTVTLTMVLDANNTVTEDVNKGGTAYALGGSINNWQAGKVLYKWADAEGNIIRTFPDFEIVLNEDTTLYAVWEDGYKMVFHPYSKGNEENPDGYFGTDPQYPGEALYIDLKGQTVGTNEQPPMYSGSENLSFGHWTDQHGNIYKASDIADQQFTEDMEFWPVWESVTYYTVTFTSKDGTFENGQNTIQYQVAAGSPLSPNQIPGVGSSITYTGGNFIANSWTGSDGVSYNPGMLMSKALDKDVTIEVGSVPAYPITVDITGQNGVSFADGSSGTTRTNLYRANQTIYYGSLPELNNSNSGYVLTGYKIDGTAYSPTDLNNYVLDGPKTLIPIWDKMVKVTFHTDGESFFSSSIDVTTDSNIEFNSGSSSKFGQNLVSVGTKILKGWTKQAGGQTVEISSADLSNQIFDTDTDLYAVWDNADVVVTLDVNRNANQNALSFRWKQNGADTSSDRVQFGLTRDAKFASYWFSPANKNDEVGYSTDPDSPIVDYTWQELAGGTHSAPSQNITLYAKYGTAVDVTLDYDSTDTENRNLLVLTGKELNMSQFKPEKTGYVLSGYTVEGKQYQPDASISIAKKCTIKAEWIQVKPAVASPVVSGEDVDSSYANTLKQQNTPIIQDTQITMSDSAVQTLINQTSSKVDSGYKAVVQLYLDVQLSGKTENSVTLDITPMYRVVKMPLSEADETKEPDGKQISQIEESQKNTEMINSRNPITVTIPVPASFNWADGTQVYIRHTHGSATHTYRSIVTNGTVSFENTEGFSKFTLSTADDSAAWVGDVGYDTLQEAVDNVSDGGTVTISSAKKLSAVVRKKISFKVKTTSENADYELSAGEGYGRYIDRSDAANPLYVFTETAKVALKPNGGSGEERTVQVNYMEEMPSIQGKNLPTRNGYSFNGYWSGNTQYYTSDGSSAHVWDQKSDGSLEARWVPVKYTISYKNLDGTSNSDKNPSSYTIESETISLANASRNGYKFEGWYSDSALTKKVSSIVKGTTGNLTFYAKWTAVSSNNSTSENKSSGKASSSTTAAAKSEVKAASVSAYGIPNTADAFNPFGTMMKFMGSLIIAVGAGMILNKH